MIQPKFFSLEDFLNWFYKETGILANQNVLSASDLEFVSLNILSYQNYHGSLVGCVCSNIKTAKSLYESSYLIKQEGVYFFPEQDKEGVPGFLTENERFREEFFSVLFLDKPSGVFFTTKKILKKTKIPDKASLTKPISLFENKKTNKNTLLLFLEKEKYVQTEKVLNPNHYSNRGGIIDVFLVNSKHPIRIEFFGDNVESIRTFNPYSQKTIQTIKTIDVSPKLSSYKAKQSLDFLFGENSKHKTLIINQNTSKEISLYSCFEKKFLSFLQAEEVIKRTKNNIRKTFLFNKNKKNITSNTGEVVVLAELGFDWFLKQNKIYGY